MRTASWRPSPTLLCLLLYLVIGVAFLKIEILDVPTQLSAPAVGDLLAYYYPSLQYGFAQLREGHLPLWNPHQSGGAPFIASLHQGFFYPLYAPFLFLEAATAVNVHLVLHLTLAALGVFLLCRHFGIPWPAAAIAGLIYGYHGSMMIKVYFPDFLNSCAAIPYLILLVDTVLTRPRWRTAGVLALVLGFAFLGGHGVQFLYFTVLAVLPLVVIRSIALLRAQGWRAVVRPAVLLGLGAALGVAVGLVRIVPFGEFVAESWRPPGRLGEFSTIMSMPPGVFREGLLTPAPSPHKGRFFPRSADSLRTAYVGIVPLVLAVLGVILWRSRALALYLTATAIVAVLYSFGSYGFVFPLMAHLPGGGWFQGVDRMLIIFGLAVAILAGAGLGEVLRRLDSGAADRSPLRRGTLLGFIVVATAAVVIIGTRFGAPRGHTLVITYGALTGALLIALALFGRYLAARAVALAGLAALLVFDLFHAQEHPGPLPSELLGYYARNDGLYATIRERQGLDRTYVYGSFNRDDPLYFYSDTAKAGVMHGLWLPTDYEPLSNRPFTKYLERLGPVLFYHIGYTVFVLTPQNMPLADLMGVRFFMLSDAGEKPVLSKYPEMRQQWTRLASAHGVNVYENPGALPRAFVVGRVEVVDEPDMLNRMETADLRSVAFVDDPRAASVPVAEGSTEPAQAEIIEYGANRVTVRTSGAGGMLVLTDQYDDGWRVTVDGAAAPLYRANYLFRGVPVPPGEHHVEFTYWPRSFVIGAAGTVIGLAAVLVLLRRAG